MSKMEKITALEVLKKVKSEMRPNAKIGEYELPVILKAMHEFYRIAQSATNQNNTQNKNERM